ncbi:MAG: TonB-dependent receptor [Ignavibacteria bacterium]|nr:TonB-dependent receptor [Ignavibacteria bacterium]
MKKTVLFLIVFNVFFSRAELIKETITNPVVVTANSQPVLYSETARIVTVIDFEQIQASNAKNIEDLLKYISNVDVRRRGGPQAQADFSVRGGSFEQTLILINGIPFNSAQTGHHNGNLPISIYDIEKIEVLEGSGSRVLGTNAFSGAVNIITKNASDNQQINFATSGGQYGYYDFNISTNFNLFDEINSFYSIYRQKSDGYIQNTDTDILNFFGSNTYRSKVGDFALQYGAGKRNFGANSFYTAKYPNQFESITSSFVNISFTKKIDNVIFFVQSHYKSLFDRFELFRSMKNAPEWYSGHNYHKNSSYGSQMKVSLASDFGISSFGLEFRNESILSNVLGKKLSNPQKISGEKDKYFYYSDNRQNISVFFEQFIKYGNISISFGSMYNWNSQFKSDFFGGLDLCYQLSEYSSLFGSINQSGRLPSFTDLYYKGPTNKGNPNLKPEYSTSLETGIKYNNDFMSSSFSIFRNFGNDLIDWIKHPDSTLWETRNLTQLNTIGLQFSANLLPKSLYNNINWFKMLSLSYTFITSTKSSQNYQSLYALDYLKHKFTVNALFSIGYGFTFNINSNYQKRNGTYYSYENNKEMKYKDIFLTSIKISYTISRYTFFMDIDNIFDKKYQDIANVTQPGRWARGGLQFTL